MSNANRQPAGAIELLDLNLMGEFPRVLGGVVSPTVEMADWYLQGIGISVAASSATITVVGSGHAVTLPANALWAIRGVSYRGQNLDPTATYQMGLRWNKPATTGTASVQLATAGASVLLNQFIEMGRIFERPILAVGGDAIQVIANQISGVPAAGIVGNVWVYYHDLALT